MMSALDQTTIRTSAADALNEWQLAAKEVEQAGRLHADRHTRETKLALNKAREKADNLLLNYYQARLMKYQTICDQQRRART